MFQTRRLLREEITLSGAKQREVNVLHQLGYYDQQCSFFSELYAKREWMKAVVAHHLGLGSTQGFRVAEVQDWSRGSFNVCIPITVEKWEGLQPGAEPGNADEKIRCEAGAYAWLQHNCPDIPIPRLYGFALSTGECYTHYNNLPFISRCLQSVRNYLRSWFGFPLPSNYCVHPFRSSQSMHHTNNLGYLLIECIEQTQGTMLSNTWLQNQSNAELRGNFFRDLSRLLLSISRIPLPRIGSFTIGGKGYLTLDNRPLTMELHELENESIPTDLSREYTYHTVESYVADLLATHDNRLRYQPNAVNNVQDCGYQMSALAAMRTTAPLFYSRDLRRGPFVFSLTDLHQSNIFVDEKWNITCLVDLEWACSRPIQMVEPPYWLTNKGVDEIDAEEYDKYRRELMAAMVSEEAKLENTEHKSPLLSEVMEQTWATGTFWFSLALSSPSGLFRLFYEHIQPLLSKHESHEIGEIMPFYWGRNAGKFVAEKLQDKKRYDHELQEAFETSPCCNEC
ncbi:hypothetical protein P170DRAFT_451803 [Aspergillus steynii IBT 23096]|uniref:Uncharacterized protein n=1 Tax=Aspergillus steynii IBT 23096 TaxID=1392250 RepID=A0A2I2GLP9_9EURO|nr:uncharacterized protein P170DRAFT_451803 [Aspergillus steynii IBT 23096]PLB53810.1 hypothetical protein P170DRAFT_451803 [Aspergillus steynii IBT 23096]